MGTAQSPEAAAPATSAGAGPGVAGVHSGEPAGTGIAHANRGARAPAVARRTAGSDATRLAPLVVTRSAPASSSTLTDPSRSVRSTRAPDACSRASVDGAG